jgi:hypothetical protein
VTPYLKSYEKDGNKMHVTAADFADFMSSCVISMKKAKGYVENQN